MTYTNKTCAIYWLDDKHTRIVIMALKSRLSAAICSFQDYEQEKNLSRQKFYFASIHDKKQTCLFLLGRFLYSLDPPQCIFLGGSGPPTPSGIDAPVLNCCPARSQKFAMGGCPARSQKFAPKPPAGGLGAKPPTAGGTGV